MFRVWGLGLEVGGWEVFGPEIKYNWVEVEVKVKGGNHMEASTLRAGAKTLGVARLIRASKPRDQVRKSPDHDDEHEHEGEDSVGVQAYRWFSCATLSIHLFFTCVAFASIESFNALLNGSRPGLVDPRVQDIV